MGHTPMQPSEAHGCGGKGAPRSPLQQNPISHSTASVILQRAHGRISHTSLIHSVCVCACAFVCLCEAQLPTRNLLIVHSKLQISDRQS